MAEDSAPSPSRAGFAQRCPRCGNGKLYDGLLRIAGCCDACGLDLAAQDSGDGPAFFVIVLMGFLTVGLAVWVEFAYEPPVWVHLLIWPVFTGIGSLWLLRLCKALLIAYQYRLKIGFSHEK